MALCNINQTPFSFGNFDEININGHYHAANRNIFDILIIFGGVMIIYYAEQMRANDLIKVGIMVPPSVNVKKMKDREGFKNYAFPRHFLQGLVLVVLGMVGIGCDLYGRADLHAIVYVVGAVCLFGASGILQIIELFVLNFQE